MSRHELLDRYEGWLWSAFGSERTVAQRLRMAERVLTRFPDPSQVGAEELLAWLGGLRRPDGRPLARASRATYYSDVRRFFGWLTDSGIIDTDPTASKLYRRPKVHHGVPKPLSAAEERRALDLARGHVHTWLLLALRAGLRAAEMASLRGEQVTETHIYIRDGKGGKDAAIPTHPELWALADRYPSRGWWFPSPRHDGHVSGNSVSIMVHRLFVAAEIPYGSIHRARHTYATTLRRRGADMLEVQKLMRHSNPASTAIYTDVDDAELRAAINLLGDAS